MSTSCFLSYSADIKFTSTFFNLVNGITFQINSVYTWLNIYYETRERSIATFYIALKKYSVALAVVAQWTECWPANQRVNSPIPSQGR